MTTQLDGADLATVNQALSSSTQLCIESMADPDLRRQRGIDFALLSRAIAAAERIVAACGADTPLACWFGETPRGKLEAVRDVAQRAAPYRPRERRA